MLLWKFNVPNNSKMCLRSSYKLPYFNQIWIFLTGFHTGPQVQIAQKSIQSELHLFMRTDGWTGRNYSSPSSDCTEIHPVRAALIHAHRWLDRS